MKMFEMPRRLRVLFQIGNINYRFYWFEFKDNNLYWGPSTKNKTIETGQFQNLNIDLDTCKASITVDPKIERKKVKAAKFSYHQSGNVHCKESDFGDLHKYTYNSNWIKPNEIKFPKLFFVVISKPIGSYEIFKQNLCKNKTSAIVLKYEKEFFNSRCLFEFYLSPPGNHKFDNFIKREPKIETISTYSLNNDLILCFKNNIYNPVTNFNTWQTDKELLFFPNDMK